MGMTYDDFAKLYRELSTIEALVERLGVSRRSVINWMRQAGIVGTVHRRHKMKAKRTTALFRWIMEHPGVKLPTTVKGIVRVTSLTRHQVDCALRHRQQQLQRHLESLTPLMLGHGTFETWSHVTLPVAAVATYSIEVDKFSLLVTIEGELRNGELFVATMSRADFKRLCDGRDATNPSIATKRRG
jgi:hypothetical protein